jgi:MFS family permease
MTYNELFSQFNILKRLSFIQFFAYFGSWFSNVAIYTMLVEFDASAFVIASITAIHFIPAVILAPFSGVIIDKIDTKRLLISLLFIESTMTIGFLFINSIDDIWMLFILLFIRMSSASIFFTTIMSFIPTIIPQRYLAKANELHSIIWSFTFIGGMAIGGLIVSYYGVRVAFVIDILFFIFAIFFLIRLDIKSKISDIKHSAFESIKQGFLYIRKKPIIIHLILLHASVGLSVFDTLITLLADYHYKYIISVPLAIGFSNAMRSIGLIIGTSILSKYINKSTLFYLFLWEGASIILWAYLQYDFYLGLIGMFIVGFGITTIWSFTYALLQENVDDEYLGRVLSYNEMMFMLVSAMTTFFIGTLVYFIPMWLISVLLGVFMMMFGVYYREYIYKRL